MLAAVTFTARAGAAPTSPSTTTLVTTGADQCGKPLTQRVGAWACSFPGTATSATGTRAPAIAAQSGWCDGGGCYARYDDFRSDYLSNTQVFGYGLTRLGEAHLYVHWTLQGTLNWADNVQFWTTRATTGDYYEGDLINAAPGATGQSVSGKFSIYNIGNCPAYVVCKWNPNGYKAVDNTMWDHSGVIEALWKVPGYPGIWYTYVKSISSHTTQRNQPGAIYRIAAAGGVPASPWGVGWHA